MNEDRINKLGESTVKHAKIQAELTRWAKTFREIADVLEGKGGKKRNKSLMGHEDKLLLDNVHGQVHFNYDDLPKSERLVQLLDERNELNRVVKNINTAIEEARKVR